MMLEAAVRDVDVRALMSQATMPAIEAGSPEVEWAASYAPPGARVSGIDWIRFGGLLRGELGWEDYPEFPETSAP